MSKIFYEKLQPLGFEIDRETVQKTNKDKPKLPAFFNSITPDQIVSFDVRLDNKWWTRSIEFDY